MTGAQLARFEAKYEPEPNSGCWLWTGAVIRNGYGNVSIGNRMVLAHRVAYEHQNGPIPAGLTLDHLCRVRSCVNPAHLEPVTNRENILRGVGPNRTHCPQGHPYDEHNTYVRNNRRWCRLCWRDSARRYYARCKDASR